MSALPELYVVLEEKGGKWESTGGPENFMVSLGKAYATRIVEELAETFGKRVFKPFPLNSAEAFEAIYGTPGVDFSKGLLPVDKDRFALAAEPLIRYLAHTHHPHTKVIVDSTSAELVEGMAVHRTEKFLVD